MSYIFQTFFYQPILNLLVFLYNLAPGHDLGLAIIVLTIIIKIILLPLSKKSIQSQKSLQDLQPKIEETKKKYANNKEEMGKAMINLYKENKVNPLSSCLPLIIQLPFFFAIFKIIRAKLTNDAFNLIYPFIQKPETINYISMGILDLSRPNVVLAVLAGAAQFWQTKMMSTKKTGIKMPGAQDENMMALMNKQMLYFMPALTVFIGLTLPGGLSLYWLTITLLTILQQFIVFKKENKKIKNSPAQTVIFK